MSENEILIRNLGMTDYRSTWEAMREFTDTRLEETQDELWITEHPPVFTQGLNGRAEHVLDPADIPVIQIDRGGQITYHGPGQLLLYCLLNLSQRGLGVKSLVSKIETSVIELLASYGIEAETKPGAPGVYVHQAKIAALGLRIRKGCCYHGLSLNVDMNLEPFKRINPCGFRNLDVTQLHDFDVKDDVEQAGHKLAAIMIRNLN